MEKSDLSGDICIVLYYNKFLDGLESEISYDLYNASTVICMSKDKLELLERGALDVPYTYKENQPISFTSESSGVIYAKLYPGDSTEFASDWEIEVDIGKSYYQTKSL